MIIRCKAELHLEVNTEDYPVPADGRITLQLKDDLKAAVEDNVPVQINQIKVIKVSQKNDDEVRDTDFA